MQSQGCGYSSEYQRSHRPLTWQWRSPPQNQTWCRSPHYFCMSWLFSWVYWVRKSGRLVNACNISVVNAYNMKTSPVIKQRMQHDHGLFLLIDLTTKAKPGGRSIDRDLKINISCDCCHYKFWFVLHQKKMLDDWQTLSLIRNNRNILFLLRFAKINMLWENLNCQRLLQYSTLRKSMKYKS